MNLFKCLLRDEAGVLLSAEAVVVGTVAVIGLTAGMSALSTAVNEELKDVAYAIRSLDQSYSVPCRSGCGAWTAGSAFQQEPVKESLRELEEVIADAERQEKAQAERLRDQLKRQEKQKDQDSEKKSKSDREQQRRKSESKKPDRRRSDDAA